MIKLMSEMGMVFSAHDTDDTLHVHAKFCSEVRSPLRTPVMDERIILKRVLM
jgi:hypothetical protein